MFQSLNAKDQNYKEGVITWDSSNVFGFFCMKEKKMTYFLIYLYPFSISISQFRNTFDFTFIKNDNEHDLSPIWSWALTLFIP